MSLRSLQQNDYWRHLFQIGFYAPLPGPENMPETTIDHDITFDEAKSKFRALVTGHVDRYMEEDPDSMFALSGGVDSTILCTIASKRNKIRTLCFADDKHLKKTGDKEFSIRAAQHIGTNHEVIDVDYSKDFEKTVMLCADQLRNADLMNVAYDDYFYAHAAKNADTLIMGTGIETLIGGLSFMDNSHYLNAARGHEYDLELATKLCKGCSYDQFEFDAKAFVRYKLSSTGATYLGEMLKEFSPNQDIWPVPDFNVHTYNQFMVYVRKMIHEGRFKKIIDHLSKKYGITVKGPFLEKDVEEFCMSLPFEYRMCLGIPKFIEYEAFKDVIPGFVMNRPKIGIGHHVIIEENREELDRLLKKHAIEKNGSPLIDYVNLMRAYF